MGTAITNFDEVYAQYAEEFVSVEKPAGGRFITTRAGVLSFNDEPLVGNQMCVVIVDSVYENTYFETRFDPGQLVPPTCYAYGRSEADMAPHPSMQDYPDIFVPQHGECSSCPHNQFGSSDKGKGKACQNRRRLALIPAGHFEPGSRRGEWDTVIYEDETHYKRADMAFLKLPPTSLRDYSAYVTGLAKSERQPPFGVFTRIWLEPDAKSQFKVRFEMLDLVPAELRGVMLTRHQAAREQIATAYRPMEDN